MPLIGNLLLGRFQLSLAFLLVLIPASVCAQNQSDEDQKKTTDEPSHCTYKLVSVEVVVYDNAGQEVADLTKDDVKIYEGGVKQVIVYFQRQEVSVNEQLSTRYTIGYAPFNEKLDDRARAIKVEARPKAGIKYFVYFVPHRKAEKANLQ